MYTEDLYFKKIDSKQNITYSVDMLRLKTYISYIEFKELEFFLNTYHKAHIKKFWCSDRVQCFHYNYLIEIEESKTFWLGFLHNSESVAFHKGDKTYNLTIEFNPNKIKEHSILIYILKSYGNWLIRSFDMAMDIRVNILDLIFDIGRRRKMVTTSYGNDNLSYAVGEGKGRYKIYNKKRESSLNIVGDLTRVEVTFQYDDYPMADLKYIEIEKAYLPDIFLNRYVMSLSDNVSQDSTLSAVLYAVQHGFPIKNLSRRYRDKIKELLEGGSRVNFYEVNVRQALNKCIFAYFLWNSKQHFK